VKIFGLDETASEPDLRAAGAFLADLREGGRPVVSCGPGQLYLGMLAAGVSASIGIAGSERARFPTDWKAATQGRQRTGRARSAYHPKYLRSFRLGSAKAKAAFANSPCRCGRHTDHEPPAGAVVDDHAAILRCREAAAALDGDVEERREWLLGLATMASWITNDAGVEHTGRAIYDALLDGLDHPDEPAVSQAS
jgi:hypothetical protein